MSYNDLVSHFFNRSDAQQRFWPIWITVVGAIVAFLASRPTLGFWPLVVITATFCFFSATHLDAMLRVARQKTQIAEALKAFRTVPTSEAPALSVQDILQPALTASRPAKIIIFHVSGTLIAATSFWIIR